MKVFIQTFGCQMNEADSAEMLAHLQLRGARKCDNLDDADIALINTCTVREHAEHRAISFLGRLAKWKKARPGRVIIFAGCAAERLGDKMKKLYPIVDIVSGAKNIDKFSRTLDAAGLFAAREVQPEQTSPLTANVTIMRGCNFKCSYCIVPTVRGPVACFEQKDVLADVRQKVKNGAKEIMLLGQTVNAYPDFDKLLLKTADIEGVERVRFMSPHPAFIDDKFIEVFKNEKIARHIHLPIQSGASEVLAHMKRGYTREILEEKLTKLARAGVLVSTDIIVGYPTETDSDFNDTLSLIDKHPFSFAYCFKFSPRAGTPAAEMKELDQNTVEQRLAVLLEKVKALSVNVYAAQKGKEVNVLMETPRKGRTSENLWFKTAEDKQPGTIFKTKVTKINKTLLE